MKPTVRIQTITPKMAEKMLDGNTHNRKLREHRVIQYAQVLQGGEWELTGDCVVIDEDGVILNGQHRLSAVVTAEMPADMVVLRGIPRKTQDVMDTQMKRSIGDALRLRGDTDVNNLGAAIAWLHRLEYARRTGDIHYATSAQRPSIPRLLSMLDERPDLRESLKLTAAACRELKMRRGLVSALHYLFSQIDQHEADVFFDRLRTGLDLTANDPIYALRRAMLNDAKSIHRMADYRMAALLIKGWNFWREGRRVSILKWNYGGTTQETFPMPL